MEKKEKKKKKGKKPSRLALTAAGAYEAHTGTGSSESL